MWEQPYHDKLESDSETGLKQLEQPFTEASPQDNHETVLDKIADVGHNLSSSQQKIAYLTGLVLILLGILGVIWSRIYLGAHSISQTLLGAVSGYIYAEFVFQFKYKSFMRVFARMFFLNFSNEYQRRYLAIRSFLNLLIVNVIMGLIYLFRLRDPPKDFSTYRMNMLSSRCGDFCRTHSTFEWKEYTGGLYVNVELAFTVVMHALNKEEYKYDPGFFRHQKWKHIILRNILALCCLLISGLPELLLKPLGIHTDLTIVVGKLAFTFLLAGSIVYIVPSIYRCCKVEGRGGFL